MSQYYVIDRGYYKKPLKIKVLGSMFLVFALAIGAWAYGPILWYESFVASEIGNRSYVSPLPQGAMVLGVNTNDYLDPKSWFNGGFETQNMVKLPQVEEYLITIPALRINKAKIKVNGDDLSKSLIHYPNTAEPGALGSGVIFGHSVLPQFYNPKNYKAIFSTLHTLSKGESIVIEYDKVLYHYQVSDKYEVNPEDMYVLEQDLSDKTLKLITCTPPGTYAKRLVVESRLVPYAGLEELYE